MDYNAFLEFEDFLFDYIIEPDFDFKGNIFPEDRKTFGDVLNKTQELHKNCFPDVKIFKSININFQKDSATMPQEKIIKEYTEKIVSEVKNDLIASNTFVKNINIEESVKEEIKEITEENNNDINIQNQNDIQNEYINQNFSEILQQKLNQSNSYTIEQINELENNLTVLNQNNYITKIELNKIEKNFNKKNEEIREEVKKDIEQQNKFLKDFFK